MVAVVEVCHQEEVGVDTDVEGTTVVVMVVVDMLHLLEAAIVEATEVDLEATHRTEGIQSRRPQRLCFTRTGTRSLKKSSDS